MVEAVRRRLARRAARAARRLGSASGDLGDLGGEWSIPVDCDPRTAAVIERVQAYTLTPPARIMALCEGIRHVERNRIDGAIVECGVWRGGSMMAAALTLLDLGATGRELWLYDTFTRMPPPGEHDRLASGADLAKAHEQLSDDPVYAIHSAQRVRERLEATGYPADRLRLVEGPVEETIPDRSPERIALLRLDTDYYESTRHELAHLYPRVSPQGLVIVDDYGEFLGARKAVDEYLAGLEPTPLLQRVDASCRQLIAT